jgi:hypothetical protein
LPEGAAFLIGHLVDYSSDDRQFGSHEVLSAKGRAFSVCCIWFSVSSRNVTSEYLRRVPGEIGLRPAGPGHRFPGSLQWN